MDEKRERDRNGKRTGVCPALDIGDDITRDLDVGTDFCTVSREPESLPTNLIEKCLVGTINVRDVVTRIFYQCEKSPNDCQLTDAGPLPWTKLYAPAKTREEGFYVVSRGVPND